MCCGVFVTTGMKGKADLSSHEHSSWKTAGAEVRLDTCAQVAAQLLLQECSGTVVGEGIEDLASPRGL